MHYKQDITGCLEAAIGKAGLTERTYALWQKKAKAALKKIKNQYEQGKLPVLSAASWEKDLEEMEATAAHIRNNFKQVVVLGTGGSTLNPQAVVALRVPLARDIPIEFLDHVDPVATKALIESPLFPQTAFLAISKSGSTLETLAQIMVCFEALKAKGVKHPGRHFFFISDPVPSPVRQLAETSGAVILNHAEDIGGRFATFTNVSLLPARLVGLDIRAFRKGAHKGVEVALSEGSAVIERTVITCGLQERGYVLSVLMPYVLQLAPAVAWQCQLLAESLGKEGKGITPVRALGPLDQHSQLQLYLDGPADKWFTLMGCHLEKQGPVLGKGVFGQKEDALLAGKTLGDVVVAEQHATAEALIARKRPVCQLWLPELNEQALGFWMAHVIIETLVLGAMLEVNPFGQPAVEEGKKRAVARLGA